MAAPSVALPVLPPSSSNSHLRMGDTIDDVPLETSSSSSSLSPSNSSSSAAVSSSSGQHHSITPRDIEGIPLVGEGGLLPANSFAGRCIQMFNCGLQDLRLLFMLLPCAAVLLFVTHQTAAGLVLVLLTVILIMGISYRLLILLRARHLQYGAVGGGGGGSRHRSSLGSMHGIRYSQLMAHARANPTAVRLAMMGDQDFTANDYDMLLQLDEEHRAQTFTGLPATVIDRLPTFKIPPSDPLKPKKEDQCSICLENKNEGDEVRALICFHAFHRTCIDPWLREHKNCPVCLHSAA